MRFSLRTLCLWGGLLAFVSNAQALGTDPNLLFRHILPDQLESVGAISGIAQDPQGFMWFAGENGLARYDGYGLTVYRHEEGKAGSLSQSKVNFVTTTRDKVLWVGTLAGLNRYNPDTDQFDVYSHPIDSPHAVSVNDVQALVEDQKGRLWLATRGGLYGFDRDTATFTRHEFEVYPRNGEGDTLVMSLVEDRQGYLWLGTHTGGLIRFDPDSRTFSYYRQKPDDPTSLSFNDVRGLFVDSKNNLITTQPKPTFNTLSGIGGVRRAT